MSSYHYNLDSQKIQEVLQKIQSFKIEIPGWGFGNGGTRFHKFSLPGAATNVYERIEDAAYVKSLTGVADRVAVSNPLDVTIETASSVNQYARDAGIALGAMNPSYYFQEEFQFGSVCNTREDIRRRAVDVSLESIEIAKLVGSDIISLWVPDGTNYAGQDDFIRRKHCLFQSLQEIYAHLTDSMRLLIEYKNFEPAFYHTDLADWGMSYANCLKLGDQAQVLVDLGHHFQGTNIEHIVAFLADEGKIGGFHVNSRRYADDDLVAGTADPYELFAIFNELVAGSLRENTRSVVENISYVVDQSHCVEDKIEAMLRTIWNVQMAYTKALLVDREALARAQENRDVLGANAVLQAAYETDVRPILEYAYETAGLNPDPVAEYRSSAYRAKIMKR